MRKTNRYIVPILATILLLALGLLTGCGQETTTYYNDQFGYSVKMPTSWEIVEKPVHWITGTLLKNTVGFRSELSPKAQWVSVEVEESPSWWIYDESLGLGEYKVQEYGKSGYLVKYRRSPLEKKWMVIYHIKHNRSHYEITFDTEKTCKKVYVSIDGYGKVNY